MENSQNVSIILGLIILTGMSLLLGIKIVIGMCRDVVTAGENKVKVKAAFTDARFEIWQVIAIYVVTAILLTYSDAILPLFSGGK